MPENPYAIPPTAPADLPDCHADGKNPEGYDEGDKTCWGCPDKFVCLPKSIDKKLIDSTLDADCEVKGVLSKTMTYAEALVRMQHRQNLIADKKPVPKDLSTQPPEGALSKPENISGKEQTDSDEIDSEQTNGGKTMAEKKKNGKPKKTAAKGKPKAPPKPAAASTNKNDKPEAQPPAPKAKPKAKPKVKPAPKKKAASKPKGEKKSRAKKGTDSKPLPKPRAVTEEQMLKSMGKIKLGEPIDLDYGMQLVRKDRNDNELIVTLTKQGYEFKGKVYGSLSAAAMVAADSPFRSGNDFFNLVSSGCTEVRDKNGKVIAKKGMA